MRRVRQPRQPLDLQRRLGLLARQHLEHRHEVRVALGLPQKLGHALARLDVLGIDRQRVEIELGRLALVVEPVVDLARLDEQARPLQPIRRVRHRLDEQLGRLQEVAVLAIDLDQRRHRRHVRRIDLERAHEARLGLLGVAQLLGVDLAGAVHQLERAAT